MEQEEGEEQEVAEQEGIVCVCVYVCWGKKVGEGKSVVWEVVIGLYEGVGSVE